MEDNAADVRLIMEGLAEVPSQYRVATVCDGEQALLYLRREGQYAAARRPDLILLDLNLPRRNGREVLEEIKSDPALRRIPVVVLTTSRADRDILLVYDLYANACVTKPVDLDEFLGAIRSIEHFWFRTATLPPS